MYFVLLIAAPAIESVFPYFFKLFVDEIPKLNYPKLFNLLLVFIAVRLGSDLIDSAKYYVGDVLMINAIKKIRKTVFGYLQDLDFAFHTNKSSGSLISAFKRGDGALWDMIHSIHYRIIYVFVSLFVMLYFFKALDVRIFELAIASFVLSLGVAAVFIRLNTSKRKALNEEEDRFTEVVVDNMTNYETVKLFGKEAWEGKRLDVRLKSWFKAVWAFVYTFRFLDIGMAAVFGAGTFLMLLTALKLASQGKITVGDFVLVATFIGFLYPKLFELIWGLRDLVNKYADIKKYFSILDNEILVKDPAKPVKIDHIYGEIGFDKIGFSYKGRAKNAINGISLKISQGESLALVGRSGSGKTTLVKLLMRFYDLDSGKISVDGIDIKDFKKSTLRGFIGVVPQEPILFNNTIAYNIGYGKIGATLSEIKAAAKIANIDEFIQSMPKKYNTQVGERGVKLSGGQKQRLAIARMILSNPDIVVFDEATSQLDSESEKLIQDAFWKARAGKTTIIIAHRLSTVMRADRIVVMEKGRIKETGTHESLLRKKGSLYSHFWNLQIKLD